MIIYLYLKTHNKTGLKYLGKTISDPYEYTGSGKYWKRHLEIHGCDITTTILRECSTKEEVKVWGEYFSTLWNIVESNEWANLKPESGDGGDPGPDGRKRYRNGAPAENTRPKKILLKVFDRQESSVLLNT